MNDHQLVSLILDKIFTFLTDYYQLPSNDPSIIDRQRIGWIFYFIEQPSTQLDLTAIFIRLARILQPWFAEQLSQMVVRMADDMNGTRKPLIGDEKRDNLLRTISMFANPFECTTEESTTTVAPLTIFPRNELNKKELALFKKRNVQSWAWNRINEKILRLGPILSDVPIGLVSNEDQQSLEMNIDLSRTDRNCSFDRNQLSHMLSSTLFSVFCSSWLYSSSETDQSSTTKTNANDFTYD